MTPESHDAHGSDRIDDWLHDLGSFGADAAYLVGLGRDEYLADTPQGRMLRNAGERLLIKVATIVERLPAEFKASYPDIQWVQINRMRNLVAHQYDKVNHDLMFVTLERDIPALMKRLGLRA
ncbi:MAG TPA: HepT-like ribonuclease domain-containing protein [Actinomycetaceae bacterium]|nr:HepT-like ribonuclease domain-containing protein [Actinomycetaceae bacterium]